VADGREVPRSGEKKNKPPSESTAAKIDGNSFFKSDYVLIIDNNRGIASVCRSKLMR